MLVANTSLARGARRRRPRAAHDDARVRADRAREPRLGADRRLGRPAAARGARSCSRWRSSWPRSRPTCCFRSRSTASSRGTLNPDVWLSPLMILGTQWYILFNVIAGASAMPSELRYAAQQLRRPRLALVAQGRAARRAPVLRDRRDHRVGRFVERGHRRRAGELGRTAGAGARSWRVHRRGHGGRRLPSHRARHRDDEPVRRGHQPRSSGGRCTTTPNASSG